MPQTCRDAHWPWLGHVRLIYHSSNHLNVPRASQAAEGAADTTVTQKVYFDVAVGGQPAGRIVIGLYGNAVPKTVANFVGLGRCCAVLS